jgi:putative addiction module killer protein
VIEVRHYIGATGRSPFADWLDDLEDGAAARVVTALYRLEQGNFSNVKSVGAGVLEYRINLGPGYRIYFGRDGETVVILLGGGTKKRQDRDINQAIACWADYRKRETINMPLTRDFRETVIPRMQESQTFRRAMLREALDCLLSGEVDVGKSMLRDFIKATCGYAALANATKIPVKSLIRMFGPSGNPHAKNLFLVVAHLQKAEGIRLQVRPAKAA